MPDSQHDEANQHHRQHDRQRQHHHGGIKSEIGREPVGRRECEHHEQGAYDERHGRLKRLLNLTVDVEATDDAPDQIGQEHAAEQ